MEPCCAIQKPNLNPKNESRLKIRRTKLPFQKKPETIPPIETGQGECFPPSRLLLEVCENRSLKNKREVKNTK